MAYARSLYCPGRKRVGRQRRWADMLRKARSWRELWALMPIRPSEKARYPKNWNSISRRIRERAKDRCECMGECDVEHKKSPRWTKIGLSRWGSTKDLRCPEKNREVSAWAMSQGRMARIVLTVAHLDHTPENCEDDNLKAMCQRCHLRYDRHQHAKNARATREANNPYPKLPLEERLG